MNISLAKVGIATYAWTAWFGKRAHSGAVYAEEVKRLVGDGDGIIAICADNTSSNTSMTKGLFGVLSEHFQWFFLGCCVHAMDLLSEDVAKLDEIAQVISDCKFIVLHVIRYPMVYETFLELQKARRRLDPKASMLGLKTFPDTRFAYAFFMIFSVFANWSNLVQLIDTPEWKLMKRNASADHKTKRRRAFLKFESLVGSIATKKAAEAAVTVMQPISTALHYLEGDSADSSHVMAVFVVADQNAKHPPVEVTEAFDEDTLDAIKTCFSDRWNGKGRKVGVKHDLHCLAFKLDLVLRFTIEIALGAPMVQAIESSFRRTSWDLALKTYSKGNNSTYTKLLREMTKFVAKAGDYGSLWTQAEAIAKGTVAEVLKTLDEDTKNNKVKLLIALLKTQDSAGNPSLTSRFLWEGHSNEASASNEERLFAKQGVEVLSVVTQACAVERINKSHGCIHNKARASLGNPVTRKALYVFTNECLLHNLEPDNRPRPHDLTSFETFLVRNATPDDSNDILSALANAPVADYLPAERDDRRDDRRSQPVAADPDGDNEMKDDDEAEAESEDSLGNDDGTGSSDGEESDGDTGYIYLDDPTPPDGFEHYEMPETAEFINPSKITTEECWYLLLCIDDGSWWLGKIKSYSPRAKKWNFTIQWGAAEGPERQAAKLENYFRLESGEAAVSGNWVYLKQSRRLSARRGRDDSDDGDDDEGGFGGDDGDSDGDGAAPARARARVSEGASSGSGSGGGSGGGGGGGDGDGDGDEGGGAGGGPPPRARARG